MAATRIARGKPEDGLEDTLPDLRDWANVPSTLFGGNSGTK